MTKLDELTELRLTVEIAAPMKRKPPFTRVGKGGGRQLGPLSFFDRARQKSRRVARSAKRHDESDVDAAANASRAALNGGDQGAYTKAREAAVA